MPVSRAFIANLYNVLLGRELDTEEVVEERCRWPRDEVIGSFLSSGEFERVSGLLRDGEPLPADLFRGGIGWAQRYWLIDEMPILPETALAVREAEDWRALLAVLAGDYRLMATAGLEPVRTQPYVAPEAPVAKPAYPPELVWSDDRG